MGLAGLDAGGEVELGQTGDLGKLHEAEGGAAKGLLATFSAIGPGGDLSLALAGSLGEQVSVDRGARARGGLRSIASVSPSRVSRHKSGSAAMSGSSARRRSRMDWMRVAACSCSQGEREGGGGGACACLMVLLHQSQA